MRLEMLKKYQILLNISICICLMLSGKMSFAQNTSKNKYIGTCIAGIQISFNRNKYPIEQFPKTSIEMWRQYSSKVGDMADKIYEQCKAIESECVRRVVKNNNDFEIMDEYFRTMDAAMRGYDKRALFTLANTSCSLINEKK
jgi:hypothetical protein